jgi:predicted AAA+ superfamily ATPase
MLKREEIIEVLSPLNFWGREQDTGIKREGYLKSLLQYLKSNDTVAVVIGVRRAGKTYLSKQLLQAHKAAPENTLYVLLEDPKFDPYLNTDLLEEIYQTHKNYVAKKGVTYLVLDEIQNVGRWEKWVRVLLEKKEKVKIIITGSSSELLASSLATVLTGRTLTLEVFPLSFKEFLLFKAQNLKKQYELVSQRRKLEKFLLEYINYGGFPQVVLKEDTTLKLQLLKEVFEGIIYRDVIARHKIKEVSLVKTVAEMGINNFSSLQSATKLRNIVAGLVGRKVSPNLVLEILSYLEEAYLLFQVPIFSYKIKDQKLYPKKFYCIDSGIINAVTIKFSENLGRLYENMVAVFLFRQRGKKNIFYWKSKLQEEVDFVVKEGLNVKQLIQVCYQLSDKKVKKREVSALLKADKELNCPGETELVIITRDLQKREKHGLRKIIYVPLWKWLWENS